MSSDVVSKVGRAGDDWNVRKLEGRARLGVGGTVACDACGKLNPEGASVVGVCILSERLGLRRL